jgi:hypothetical protein
MLEEKSDRLVDMNVKKRIILNSAFEKKKYTDDVYCIQLVYYNVQWWGFVNTGSRTLYLGIN